MDPRSQFYSKLPIQTWRGENLHHVHFQLGWDIGVGHNHVQEIMRFFFPDAGLLVTKFCVKDLLLWWWTSWGPGMCCWTGVQYLSRLLDRGPIHTTLALAASDSNMSVCPSYFMCTKAYFSWTWTDDNSRWQTPLVDSQSFCSISASSRRFNEW
jgi:hypothetical protein